jgi:hypothetical protein
MPEALAKKSPLIAEGVIGSERYVAKRPDMTWPDHLVMLLNIAAEIEHALMVQYLYAAYSLGGDGVQRSPIQFAQDVDGVVAFAGVVGLPGDHPGGQDDQRDRMLGEISQNAARLGQAVVSRKWWELAGGVISG